MLSLTGGNRQRWCLGFILIACTPFGIAAQQSRALNLEVEALALDVDLSAIRWAFMRADQTIVFADDGSRMVYVRSPTGVVSALGRHGDGPGEYRFPSSGYTKGDSIVIHEIGLGRREAISLNTGHGNSHRFIDTPVGMTCRVVILISDQGVCQETRLGQVGSGSNTLTTNWFRLTPAGHELRVIQVAYDSAYVARLVHSKGVLYVPRPYSWASRSSLTQTGRLGAVMRQVPIGGDVQVRVTTWEITNGRNRTITRTAAPVDVPGAAGRGLAARAVGELGRHVPQLAEQSREFETALVRGWRLAKRAPPYSALFVSDDRCLWLQRTDVGWPRRGRDVVFDRWTLDGQQLQAVSTRAAINVLSVDCNRAVAVERDGNDVPQLLLLRVP